MATLSDCGAAPLMTPGVRASGSRAWVGHTHSSSADTRDTHLHAHVTGRHSCTLRVGKNNSRRQPRVVRELDVAAARVREPGRRRPRQAVRRGARECRRAGLGVSAWPQWRASCVRLCLLLVVVSG